MVVALSAGLFVARHWPPRPLAVAVPAAIAASCAFMLPVATPPNAIVFGSGRLSIRAMSRAGLWLNLVGVVLITGLAYGVALPLLAATHTLAEEPDDEPEPEPEPEAEPAAE